MNMKGLRFSKQLNVSARTGLILLTAMLLVTAAFLTACSGGNAATSSAGSDNISTVSASGITDSAGQTFTLEQLAQYDGKDGQRAYIAVDGIVYDVTDVSQWGAALHAGRFIAGKDYTEELKNAPHNAGKLDDAKKVGTLIEP